MYTVINIDPTQLVEKLGPFPTYLEAEQARVAWLEDNVATTSLVKPKLPVGSFIISLAQMLDMVAHWKRKGNAKAAQNYTRRAHRYQYTINRINVSFQDLAAKSPKTLVAQNLALQVEQVVSECADLWAHYGVNPKEWWADHQVDLATGGAPGGESGGAPGRQAQAGGQADPDGTQADLGEPGEIREK